MIKVKNTVIVPSYNEEKAIAKVLENILNVIDESYEIIVVDDGSRDNTVQIASNYPCKVIVHGQNLGKGAAIRTGIKYAQGENILFIDADDTYPVEAIQKIVEELKSFDMVVARRITRVNINFFNRIGNIFFKKLIQMFYHSPSTDPLSGLYGLRKEYLKKMQVQSIGFEIETEITIKASQMGLRIKEIPISYNKRMGDSKLDPIKDGYRILHTIISYMFLYNPTMSFIIPGLILFSVSTFFLIILSRGPIFFGTVTLSIHTLIFSSMLGIVGVQLSVFGMASKLYAIQHKFCKPDAISEFFVEKRLSKPLLLLGLISIIIGVFLSSQIAYLWIRSGFSPIHQINKAIDRKSVG